MNLTPSSKSEEQDRDIIKLLEELGSIKDTYPPELLADRRAAFLSQVDLLTAADAGEELSAGDQEVVHLLGTLKSVQLEYPPHLLAARRSAFLQQMERAAAPGVWEELRLSIRRIFQSETTIPGMPLPGFLRTALVIGSLIVITFLGSRVLSRTEQAAPLVPSLGATTPTSASTAVSPTGSGETAILICKLEDSSSCPPGGLNLSQDLANPGNGVALPAVSNDGVHKATYVNDGRVGTSWVSNSPDSWIKIDLGQVRTINTVSVQNGSAGLSQEGSLGHFVIAVALSDMYADGDNSHDYREYAQVFHSEQTGFSGRVSQAETIRTHFSPIQARYIKITFEEAGAAIEEVGVFMVEPTVLAEQPTRTPGEATPGITSTPVHINTVSALDSATSAPTGTRMPTNTAVPISTDIATLAPTEPLPTDTPIPLPTVIPPTTISPTVSTEPIIVTGNGQTLTFTCNSNDTIVRGHENTVTLMGSRSSITVTGNGNSVFWQYGSPVITNRGEDNTIRQL